MTDREGMDHPYVEWIAGEARRPIAVSPEARRRLLAAIRAEPQPVRRARPVGWLVRSRDWSFSPVSALAMAAGLVAIGLFGGRQSWTDNRDGQPIGQPSAVAASMPPLPVSDSTTTVQVFVFVAPSARQVSLVGDFNEWTVGATPMVRDHESGVWMAAVPLAVGRHTYSFVVDEAGAQEWRVDPRAPLTPDDGFGHSSSVVLVPHASAL